MPRQNRVLATSEIVAHPARGTMMGNRGILHDDAGRLTNRRWRHRNWVCCVTEFKGRRRKVMTPGRYTELFFLDEAVALAAGHRPCAECRRADYVSYCAAVGHVGRAAELDARLHQERAVPRRFAQRREVMEAAGLPDFTIVLRDDNALLLIGDAARPVGPEGYGPAVARPTGPVEVLTPATSRAALAGGFTPRLHPSF